jgi:hypothetical protein
VGFLCSGEDGACSSILHKSSSKQRNRRSMGLLQDIRKRIAAEVRRQPSARGIHELVCSVDASANVGLPLGNAQRRLDPWVSSVRTARGESYPPRRRRTVVGGCNGDAPSSDQ